MSGNVRLAMDSLEVQERACKKPTKFSPINAISNVI